MSEKQESGFKCSHVELLLCEPATFDHGDGEAATIITVDDDGEVLPLVISLKDTRALIVGLLTSLWTAEDEHAGQVLRRMFPVDGQGDCYWPKEE